MNPEPFQAPTLEELAPLFPHYTIDAFIAKGGMGAVYLATQTSLERQVAIKILPRELGKDREFRESFAAEAKAMAKLNHPNLIGVYDFGEVDAMPFIVMEYVAGKPLHDSAYGKQIDPLEAARIVQETCRGLHHAHEHNILHRDVKPANILLEPLHAEPKLGDFGLAMAASEEGDDGLIFGTPGYAAPEVYEGRPDERSDVYAAAVILYQLLTGKMPDSEYQHPSELSDCDFRFDTLLAKALQPDADHRFQNAEELAEELEAIRREPVVADEMAPPPHPSTPLASAKIGNGGLILAALTAMALIGAGVFFYTSKENDEALSEVAETPSNEVAEVSKQPQEPSPPENTSSKIEENPSQEMAELNQPQEVEEPEEIELPEESEEEVIAMEEEEEKPLAVETAAVEPEKPVSTFDHLAFLERGRKHFADNGKKAIETHEAELLKNIDRLEREGKSILRDEEYITRDSERARKANLELTISKFKEAGRLPGNLDKATPASLAALTWRDAVVAKAIREALDDQKEIDLQLEDDLRPSSKNYADGVRRQVSTLKDEGNEYDASILEAEANLAQTSFPYFLKIVKGENPFPPSLKDDPEDRQNMSLEELFVGKWVMRRTGITFVISDDGTVKSSIFRMPSSWTVIDDKIYIDWRNHRDEIVFEDGEFNQFSCLNLGNKQTNIFTRVEPKTKNKGRENALSDPIVGEWSLITDDGGEIIFTFDANHDANNGEWNAKGTWAEADKGYLLTWGNGKELNVRFEGPKNIVISSSDTYHQLTRK